MLESTKDGDEDHGYDSDGVRFARSGDETPERRRRRAWRARAEASPASFWTHIASWTQTTRDVNITVSCVGCAVRGRDVCVEITPTRLTVRIPSWAGTVTALTGALSRRVKPSESYWTCQSDEIFIALAKDDCSEPHGVFMSVLEGGPARSHADVLRDMVAADEPFAESDALSRETKALVETMRDRYGALARGDMLQPEDDMDFKLTLSL